ncbi:unnamed protein product [Larinioides sclopetarius]|uniref:C2H2-type domain-containing protein n=1 Tax=Larinioides sclopetarius TaxID=280406 RepID=A0AAV2BM11_9ARAC
MEESLYCKICFKKCSGVSELKLHVESRHQKRLRTDNAELPNESSKKSDDADEVPVKPVEKKDGWVPLSTKPFKKNKKEPESFIDHNRIEREYVECNVCQEICADESALRKHCEQHLLQNQTTCGVCAKIFRNVYALNEHFKSHKSSLYACYICDEQYRTKEGLSRHKVVPYQDNLQIWPSGTAPVARGIINVLGSSRNVLQHILLKPNVGVEPKNAMKRSNHLEVVTVDDWGPERLGSFPVPYY